MKVKFNVKDKSVETFLSEKMIGFPMGENKRCDRSVHNLLTDVLIFKKDCGIKVNEVLNIELFDQARGSGKTLVNKYEYTAEEYDDFSIKLKLTNFKVELSAENIDFCLR